MANKVYRVMRLVDGNWQELKPSRKATSLYTRRASAIMLIKSHCRPWNRVTKQYDDFSEEFKIQEAEIGEWHDA